MAEHMICMVDAEYAHSGEYGMLIENRADQYAIHAMNITDIVMENGPGTYKASVWVKLRVATTARGTVSW